MRGDDNGKIVMADIRSIHFKVVFEYFRNFAHVIILYGVKMSSKYEELLKKLQEGIKNVGGKITSKEKCLPTMLIAGIAAPILIWLVLYFVQPRFVSEKEGNKHVLSKTKVFYWTVIFTILVWIAMYLWTWCRGLDKVAMLCST